MLSDPRFISGCSSSQHGHMMGTQGQKQQVKTIEAGGFFGEVALVEHVNVRAADCIAKDRVKLLSMGRDTFERLMGPAETILAGQVSEYQKFNANASSCHSAAAEVV